MARRRPIEEPVNHERWLVSYADFITLLFAFFVVMYSISSVNEGKYRVLSDSMVSAFQTPKSSLEPIQVGQLVRSPVRMVDAILDVSEKPTPVMIPLMMEQQKDALEEKVSQASSNGDGEMTEFSPDENFSQKVLDAAESEINSLATDVEEKMDSLIDEGIVNIKRNKFWLEVEIKSNLLFPSGGSGLIESAKPVLIELSDVFVDLPNRLHIEGFTDNKPIHTEVFPSNWELSSARAAAVVRLFESNGVDPSRMASIGYGEYHPIADNDSEEGRGKNRRVVVVVMASLEGRKDERIYEFELLKDGAVVSSEI